MSDNPVPHSIPTKVIVVGGEFSAIVMRQLLVSRIHFSVSPRGVGQWEVRVSERTAYLLRAAIDQAHKEINAKS